MKRFVAYVSIAHFGFMSRFGIWIVSYGESKYPQRLHKRLGHGALPLLFGIGQPSLLNGGGVCVVGSRNSSAEGREFARVIGERCGREGLTIISSDMRGIDRDVVASTLHSGGKAVCVLSDSLEKTLAAKRFQPALQAGTLAVVTPFSPDARFKVANAIRANKYQYALSDVAVIVDTRQTGGVWLGADENRTEAWVPAFVRTGEDMLPGNLALLHLGLRQITRQDVELCPSLGDFFVTHGLAAKTSAGPASIPKTSTSVDLYGIFVAELRTIAAAPRTEAEIIGHFGVELDQARAWLARAIADGIVERVASQDRYVAR